MVLKNFKLFKGVFSKVFIKKNLWRLEDVLKIQQNGFRRKSSFLGRPLRCLILSQDALGMITRYHLRLIVGCSTLLPLFDVGDFA